MTTRTLVLLPLILLTGLMTPAQTPGTPDPTPTVTFPGITLIPTLTATKSDQKALRSMGLPARDSDAIFVFVQFKDPGATAYTVTLKYSWLGQVYSFSQIVPVTDPVANSSQAVAIFDIPDMGVIVLGVSAELSISIPTPPPAPVGFQTDPTITLGRTHHGRQKTGTPYPQIL